MFRPSISLLAFALGALLMRTASAEPDTSPQAPWATYRSTYLPADSGELLFKNATLLDGVGHRYDGYDLLVRHGKVVGIGKSLTGSAGTTTVDATGKWITPGIIDAHSHLGGASSPSSRTRFDINERTNPVTPYVSVQHAVWPQDPGFFTALAGGVTTLDVLPGSTNLIGGRGVLLKNVASVTVQGMMFAQAPTPLKMACGENPKNAYGTKGGPSTAMGNMAGYRAAFLEARAFLAAGRSEKAAGNGQKLLGLQTMADVLEGKLPVQIHCYRADEMAQMIELSHEFDFKIAAFHHAVEAFKIRDMLAREGICVATWGDRWVSKLEGMDSIQENAALLDAVPGGCVAIHSDSADEVQRLNQEAGKVIANAKRIGLEIPPERAMTWLTSNPARMLGVADRTGSLAEGLDADIVVWNRNPFSSYALAESVYIDGVLRYARGRTDAHQRSDFFAGWEK